MYLNFFKPIIDFLISLACVCLLFPIFCITAIAILIEDGRPILFVHNRVGRGGSYFKIYKFRSMKKDVALVESSSAVNLKITRVGTVIRRLNIDELPQLLNVLQQNMSIVGPRPALPSQTDLHKYRAENGAVNVLPGITGLAQVNSYDGMTAEEKAEYDGKYARTVSAVTDLKIIYATFGYFLNKPPTY